MKIIKNILFVLAITIFALNCKNEAKPEVKTVDFEANTEKAIDANATYAKAEFTIDGMTCAVGCAKTIESKLGKMEGVKSAKVDFDRKLAMVEYNEAKVTPNSLVETVAKVGDSYTVSNMKTMSNSTSCKKECDKTGCEGKTDAEKAACQKACTATTASNDMQKSCCANKAKA
jgi:mercuric ion binding protein